MRRYIPAAGFLIAALTSSPSLMAAQAHHHGSNSSGAQQQDAGSFTVPRPEATYEASARAVPFDLFRSTRMFLKGSINGKDTEMMLDTGASSTVLDTEFARSLGIRGDRTFPIRGAGGSIPGEIASDVTIRVGSMTLRNASVIIMDLKPIALAIGRPIPVVLGHEAIDAGPVRIDFPGRTITFMPAKGFTPPSGATEVPLGHDGPFRSVKISVAGLPPVDATFDIGNGGTIVLAKSYWEKLAPIASLKTAASQIGGVGGMKPARRVTLPEVGFAGQSLKAVPAMLNEDRDALPTEGANVGIEMLKPFVVTADYANNRLYLERSGEWPGFRRERAGVLAHHHGDRLKVQFVSADGPGAAAGLKAGDEIVAINGQPVGKDFYASANADWALAPSGTPVTLKRADGTEARLTLRDYY